MTASTEDRTAQGGQTHGDEPALSTVNRLVTWGRMAWFVIALVSGGIGTGVGFLLGEGAARAAFDGTIKAHEGRIASLEGRLGTVDDKVETVLTKVGTVDGKVDAILTVLRGGK